MLHILGIFAGILTLIADIPYILDTYRKKTKPHRTTWFLFFLINAIFFANQYAAGARNSLGLTAAYVIASFIIAMLSLRNGIGGYSKEDLMILGISFIGVVLWVVLKSPLASILANIFAVFVATIPTIKKAWKDPESETKFTWGVSAISSLLGAMSVGKLDVTLLLLPVYAVLIDLVVYTILIRKKLFSA